MIRGAVDSHARSALSLVLSGLSVGWLVGLSVSPVLHLIVESVVGITVAAVSVLVGIKVLPVSKGDEPSEGAEEVPPINSKLPTLKIDLSPLALFTVSLAVGASLGVFARTNEFLGPRPDILLHRWKGTGLNDTQLKSRLFDTLYPPEKEPSETSPKGKTDHGTGKTADLGIPKDPVQLSSPVHDQLAAGLFTTPVESCDLLRLKHGDDLKTRLQAFAPDILQQPIKQCQSEDCLNFAKELLCPNGH